MRLDKLLANIGYGSRKEVKKLLKQGGVTIEGKTEKSGQTQVDPENETIEVLGETVEYQPYIYLLMNKPKGVISATIDDVHETVVDILEIGDAVRDPYPVGRLDKDTEGLLLLTNDGKFAHALTSPNRGVPKTYVAKITAPVTDEDIEAFKQGVELDDGYVTKPAELKVNEEGEGKEVTITIKEGKYHQIKRMFEARGKRVIYLQRIKMGSLELDPDLEPGEYRDMDDEEVQMLLEESQKKD